MESKLIREQTIKKNIKNNNPGKKKGIFNKIDQKCYVLRRQLIQKHEIKNVKCHKEIRSKIYR